MNLSAIKEEYEAKLQRLKEELDDFIGYADNYEDLLSFFGDKADLDLNELEWCDLEDQRRFDNLQNTIWMYESIIAQLDEISGAGDDKKKLHRLKKNIEVMISDIRNLKNMSKNIIEREQKFLGEADSVLALLDDMRRE